MLIYINMLSFQLDSCKDLKSYQSLDKKLHPTSERVRETAEGQKGWREGSDGDSSVWSLTITLCCPVRFGGSHSSWVSETVTAQGVSPISTV